MKKYLSIILSLVLILGTVFAVPVTSVSAEGVTAASFTDGVTWGLSEGGTDYLRLTAGWGSFTGANGSVSFTDPNSCRSVMANVTGFTAGTTYKVTFSATGVSNVYVVLNYGAAYFDGNQSVQVKSGYESDVVYGAVSNGIATITFTPTSDNIYLIVKSNSSGGTLSNFSVKALTETDIILDGINNGLTWGLSEGGTDYLRLTAGWGSFTSSNGSVAITDPNSCRSTMAQITGFTAGATYKISFNATGVSAVYAVLNYDSAYFDGNQIVQAKSGYESDLVGSSVSNDVATIIVTPTSDNFYLIVKNNAGSVALSNFAVSKLTEEEIAGMAIANGEWNITKNASGTVTKSNNTVSFTGANYQSMYTKLTGLTANTEYKLSFDVNTTLNGQVWLLSGDAAVSFIIDGTVPSGGTGIGSVDGTTATVSFVAQEDSYYIFFRNSGSSGATSAFTFSNFKFETVKTFTDAEIAGIDLANNGNWAVTQGAGGVITKSNGTVTVTGSQYQQISLSLTGLEKNTTYTLTFDHSAGDQWQFANPAYVIPGETAWTSGLNSKEGTVSFGDGSCNTATSTTIRFTTNSTDSKYLVVFNCNAPYYNGTLGTVVLSNFQFSKDKTFTESELAGIDLANNGNWAVTQGAGGVITKSNGTVTVTGSQYQQISLSLTGLEKNTTYTLTFDHSAGDQWQFANPAYVIPGETAWTSGLNSKEGTVSFGDGSCNTEVSTTIRFTTNSTDSEYLVVFNCNAPYYNGTLGTVVLSNFQFSNETAYEAIGTAIRAAFEETTQAMRFKNTISKDLLANGYNGKEVVEYGTLAAFEANLVTDFTYENVDGLRIKKGVAYDKANNINVVFAEDDVDVTYTAALTNIKTRFYGLDMKVCSYMVLSDGSVIYGDLQTISVYGIMNAILNGDNDDDKAVVNAMLEDEAVLNGYNAWLAK